ncbi:MAG: FAD-dependent oxidoreductase, partial [Verrucomicrobiales bacterium]|nr:FAD-dependent oxidoreductase [Verrucomicrobiales bacterium]
MRLLPIALLALSSATLSAESLLVEAESFSDRGGWKLDTQFIDIMGSPYLLAHGLGQPVKDATTTVRFPAAGTYNVYARTKNWVAPFGAEGTPGEFQLLVDGKPTTTRFGTSGKDWHWQKGAPITVTGTQTTLTLKDLTGFDGRCDALYFSTSPTEPDNSSEVLPAWRRRALGISEKPVEPGPFDLVVIGGGYAGSCAAISAARMGIKVALVQNRGVLGGNGSSEVRVWAMGNTPTGLYPVGDIVNEFSDHAKKSPGTYQEFEDDKKTDIVSAEKNISLFLNHHAYAVEMHPGEPKRIKAILALDTRTNEIKRFTAPLFSDCTGHATIGMLAGADRHLQADGRMGMSNMWAWANADAARSFPETPWALQIDETGFPYPRDFHAQWFWESGYDKHPLDDLELIRDHNLRASYGAWNAIKNKSVYSDRDPA